MLSIRLICVGKLKENYFYQAMSEYEKRLHYYCRFECLEIPEVGIREKPSESEILQAIDKEGQTVIKSIPDGAFFIPLCIEGKKFSSEGLANILKTCASSGKSKICFAVGGSFGLSESVKKRADVKLSMSDMTFPHHLARVMITEQIYRGFKINEGSAYHK